MQYQLALRNGKNNYQPMEYQELLNEKEENFNPHELENIDNFTKQYNNQSELKQTLLMANFLENDDLDKELVIIFKEKGKFREVEEGICYKNSLTTKEIIAFLLKNILNPQILNKIYNKFRNVKNPSSYFLKLLEVLKNVKKAQESDLKNIYGIILLEYIEKRNLGLYISYEFCDILNKEDTQNIGGDRDVQRIRIFEKK